MDHRGITNDEHDDESADLVYGIASPLGILVGHLEFDPIIDHRRYLSLGYVDLGPSQ